MLDKQDLQALSHLLKMGLLEEQLVRNLVAPVGPVEALDRAKTIQDMLDSVEIASVDLMGATVQEDEDPARSTLREVARAPTMAVSAISTPALLEEDARYELVELIGKGGVGEVWLAVDRALKRHVALKVLTDPRAPKRSRERFEYEAQTTGRLAHPCIIPVHDVGQLPDGRWFYVMERIHGRNLGEILNALRAGDAEAEAHFTLPRLLHIFTQLCLTVAYAHDHRIIHRDLKPENVMVGEYGEVFVLDWGLAKFIGEAPTRFSEDRPGRETTQGVILGTLFYMSPEQLSGNTQALTAATDVYSLGVMLFEILTLELPFVSDTALNLMLKIVSATTPDPREATPQRRIPTPLAELTLEAMQRDVDKRSPSARYLAERVSAFLDGVEAQHRRQKLAAELIDRAHELASAYIKLRDDIAERRVKAEHAQRRIPITAPMDARMTLWRRSQDISEKTLEAEQLFAKAIQSAEQVLEYDEDVVAAHDLLADLYWLKYRDAAQAKDNTGKLYFRALVLRHDTGRYADKLSDTGSLSVESTPPDATLRVERQQPFGPLLLPQTVTGFSGEATLRVGSYVVHASAKAHLPARFPVQIEGHQTLQLTVTLPPAFPGHEAFVLIPAGEASIGGDPGAPDSLPTQRLHVDAFLIGQHPITNQAYADFLTALAETDPDQAHSHAPRSGPDGSETYWFDYNEATRTFTVPEHDQDGDPWDPLWPVTLVSYYDAEAYCAWRSQRDGARYRLPTEIEWEKAARGIDGRIFPWGNGFDPALCCMAQSNQNSLMPLPVGSHEFDCSPYGVRDMAGLVVEWTSTRSEDGVYVITRGGGFKSPAEWCRAATRRVNHPTIHPTQLGFRIVREL